MKHDIPLTESIARKVLSAVDAGLVRGLGKQKPGHMCVEAAVCYAYGLPHSDNPPCVGSAVRAFKIRLNDARWSSNEARTLGMRALAIAQLGSDAIDQQEFAKMVAEGTIRQIVPLALRKAADSAKEPHKQAMLDAALVCERDGTRECSLAANKVARDAVAAAAAAAYEDAYADELFNLSADIALQALLALDSPGCAYLGLLAEAA